MSRWMWKRWAWGVLAGAAIATGPGLSNADDKPALPELPKPNDTITLRFAGQPEQKVKVIKATRKPDGTVVTEVKDPATGQTFTLEDAPPGTKPETTPDAKAPTTGSKGTTGSTDTPTGKNSILPRAKDREADPLTPAPKTDTSQDKRLLGGRLFGKDQQNTTSTTPPTPPPAPPADPPKRQGLLTRIFGPKKPSTPAAPATAAMPSPAKSTTSTGPTTGGGVSTPSLGVTTNPPQVMPQKQPVPPPPPPVQVDTAPPIVVVPTPLPMTKSAPVPVPLPAPPSGLPIPPIPSPPGGMQSALPVVPGRPIEVILPVGYVPPDYAQARDIRPYATTLKEALSPAARMTAAKALADGRHGSTDEVKGILFQSALADPCPEVRACCIEHLCRLGYYNPDFIGYLKTAVNDGSEDVRDAAKAALEKMTPR